MSQDNTYGTSADALAARGELSQVRETCAAIAPKLSEIASDIEAGKANAGALHSIAAQVGEIGNTPLPSLTEVHGEPEAATETVVETPVEPVADEAPPKPKWGHRAEDVTPTI